MHGIRVTIFESYILGRTYLFVIETPYEYNIGEA